MTERKYTVTALMAGAVAPINMQTEAKDFGIAAEWAKNFGAMSGFTIVGVKETSVRTKKDKEMGPVSANPVTHIVPTQAKKAE